MKKLWIISLMFLTAMIILLRFPYAQAETITVDDDGDADYSDLQEAINNASTGDVIKVYPGDYTYNRGLKLSKNLMIIGNSTAQVYINKISITSLEHSIMNLTLKNISLETISLVNSNNIDLNNIIITQRITAINSDNISISNSKIYYNISYDSNFELTNVHDSKISNNLFINDKEEEIEINPFYNSIYSIKVTQSSRIIINGNSIQKQQNGILIDNSHRININDNSFKDLEIGVVLLDTYKSTISSNNFNKCNIAIKMMYLFDNNIEDNSYINVQYQIKYKKAPPGKLLSWDGVS